MLSPSPLDDETRDLLALRLTPGLGPRLTKALLDKFGSARAVLQASTQELSSVPRISDRIAQELVAQFRTVDVSKEIGLLEKYGAHVVTLGSAGYPESLKTIFDPPPLLYARGELTAADGRAVAIVGSRQCTSYGRKMAERLAEGLVRAGYTVVSGLARGIDGWAHRAALQAGGRTIAVLAGGLGRLYPPEHADLATEIAAHGAVLSENTMDMAPLAEMFPARNRLISGLSRGVVVVEATEKSGALITARHAADQGRDVFAFPGAADSAASAGTLRLIRDGATLIRGVEDILSSWGEGANARPPAPPAAPKVPLTPIQEKVLQALSREPVNGDDLVRQTLLSVSELGTTLMMLEMQGLVRRLPGNRFERR